MIRMSQVHGNKVVIVDENDDGKTISNCDGLITLDPKLKLTVRAADCLPIEISDKKFRIHGVIHAGWRGLKKKIIKNAIELIEKKFEVSSGSLLIVIGPHICVEHYEVKDDVAKFFNEIIDINDKKYLDLGLIAKNQFLSLGVLDKNIKIDKRCTFESKEFFSFRRDRVKKSNCFTF